MNKSAKIFIGVGAFILVLAVGYYLFQKFVQPRQDNIYSQSQFAEPEVRVDNPNIDYNDPQYWRDQVFHPVGGGG